MSRVRLLSLVALLVGIALLAVIPFAHFVYPGRALYWDVETEAILSLLGGGLLALIGGHFFFLMSRGPPLREQIEASIDFRQIVGVSGVIWVGVVGYYALIELAQWLADSVRSGELSTKVLIELGKLAIWAVPGVLALKWGGLRRRARWLGD